MHRFSGTNVVLTGGGSGIGRATVQRLVSEGAAVYTVDRDADGLAETAEVALGSGRVVTEVVDVRHEAAVVASVAAAHAELGSIDVLVNAAETHRSTPIATLSVADLRALFEVNLVGTAVFCREVVPHLPDGAGVIVNIASSSATHGHPSMSAYSASKGAVLGFTLSLAAELAGRGIRVVSVSPGQADTTSTCVVGGDASLTGLDVAYVDRLRSPWGPATPEQLAGTIVFAASRDAAYLTGVDLRVDGGSHISAQEGT